VSAGWVPLDPFLDAFGVPATVTRPVPEESPVTTTAVWVATPEEDPQPVGTVFRRREPRRILVLPRADLATLPNGTTIVAAEEVGSVEKTWIVDGLDRVEADTWRAIVKLAMT